MARSMTGFGVGSAAGNGLSISAELKSVNNRFLDFNTKLPRQLIPREQDIRDLLQRRILRGRVSVFIAEEWTDGAYTELRIDWGKAKPCFAALEELRSKLQLKDEIRIEHLLSAGDLFIADQNEEAAFLEWELAKSALEEALEQLLEVSNREGASLVKDIRARAAQVREDMLAIEKLAAAQPAEYRERMLRRLGDLTDDARLDPARLETEFAIAADRLDISEEIIRFKSHLEILDKSLSMSKPIGKTLGFILQEMGREANTIASKSWLKEISQAGIRIKEALEQMREQAQNIE